METQDPLIIHKKTPTRINVLFQTKKQLDLLADTFEFRSFTYAVVIEHIEDALKNNLDEIIIFDVFNFSLLIKIKKENYIKCLKHMLKFYEKVENFEKCILINKLIKK